MSDLFSKNVSTKNVAMSSQHTFCLECSKKVATKKLVQCALSQRKHKLPVNGVIGLPNNSILKDLFQMTYSDHFNNDIISKC